MFEKPFLLIDRAAVTIHDINHWIQFKERLHLIGQNRNIPQDRRRPHPDLKHNTDDLLQIPEKNNHRTGDITNRQHKHELAKTIIKNLQRVNIRIIPISDRNRKQYTHKKDMDKRSRYYFYNWQDADRKSVV